MKSLTVGLLAFAAIAFGQAPVVNITAPTGTVFVPDFPAPVNVTFTLAPGSTSYTLGDVNVLKVEIGNSTVLDLTGNPFDSAGCKRPPLPQNVACSVNSGLTLATMSVPWNVPQPGEYVVNVSLKYRGDNTTDTEVVTFALVSVEYPAPPSIANEYINGTPALKSAAPKTRGCVVNEIAREHGQNAKYGPKGGPYNKPAVYADTYAFWIAPCGASWPNGVSH